MCHRVSRRDTLDAGCDACSRDSHPCQREKCSSRLGARCDFKMCDEVENSFYLWVSEEPIPRVGSKYVDV